MMKKTSYRNRAFVRNRVFVGIASFALPVSVLLTVYGFLRIHPFGANTVLFTDLRGQYISFLSYFRRNILEGGSFLYTFSKNLGGDMVGLSAYYLSSPLNLLLLLFDTARLPSAVLLLQLIRVGLCGLAMSVYLNRNGVRGSTVLFSSCYALMAYTIVYSPHIMWMDAVILLPIVALGIEKLHHKRSPFVYIASLGLAMITNYYTGFMLCLFSVLYFCYLLFLDAKKNLPSIVRFGWASLLAGGLSAFVLLPLLHSLQGGKMAFSLDALRQAFAPNFQLFDLLSKLFIGSYSEYEMFFGLPNIYCGMLTLLFCVVFFLNNDIPFRKKLGLGLLLLTLLASFYIGTLNMVWHGLHAPAGFPYRYSFVFCFLLVSAAFQGYQRTKPVRLFRLYIPIFMAMLFLATLVERYWYAHLNWVKIYLGIALLLLMVIALFFAAHPRHKKIGAAGLLLLCLLDLGANAYLSLSWVEYGPYGEYVSFVQANEPVIDSIQTGDPSFFRMEKTYQYSHNDPMLLGYRGLSHFSSGEKRPAIDFMRKMGFSGTPHWAYYNRGSTVSVDSLLGIKYLLAKEQTEKPYIPLAQHGDISVYQNPYALPLGFLVQEDALGVDMDEENLFALQNNLWARMTGETNGQLFVPAAIEDVALTNLFAKAYEGGIRYYKQDAQQDAYIEYILRITQQDPLYAHFSSDIPTEVELFLNDRPLGVYFDVYRWDIVQLGSHDAGAQITLKVLLKEENAYIHNPLFYYQDMGVFSGYLDVLSASPYRVDRHTGSRLEGTVLNPGGKRYMLTSIPYDAGWNVRINDSPASATQMFGALLAFEVPEGEHAVVLAYLPPYLHLGIAISALSLGALVVLFVLRRRAIDRRNPPA